MTIIDIINEPHHKRQFGMIIRLYRIRQQHSLRTLAERTNVSHAYLRRIETGRATISKQTYDYLTQTLNIEVRYDEDEEIEFFNQSKDVFNNILYFDLIESEANMNKLEIKAAYHEQSLWMVDFLIMKMGYYNFMTDTDFQQTTTLYRELNAIRDLFDEEQLQTFLTYAGTYFFNTSNYDAAMEKYKEAVEISSSNHLNALDEYLIGRAHMLRHHYSKAIRNLRRAHGIFKTYNNYVRISHTRIMIETMKLMTSKRNDAESFFNDSFKFARKYRLKGVEAFMRFTYALYHYRLEAYDSALAMLLSIDGESVQYTYYEALIYLKKGDRDRALKAVRKGRALASKPRNNALLYKYGLDVVELYCQGAPKEYEAALSRFYDEATSLKSYIESKDAYHFYVEMLESKRRYKKAYQLTQEFTDFTMESLH